MERGIFKRTELLLGDKVMNAIQQKRIIVFGVGGVGSWCVECLIRSGIQHMTIVDSDCVCTSNVNRQLMATMQTVGEVKVEALKKRLLEINPDAEITALQQVYSAETADSFHIETYDYIVDAIDSLDNKALLIRKACETDAVFVSSMGAALKMDPAKIAVAEFWKVKGCPLAAALRRKFKKSKLFPGKKFKCVYSEELLKNVGVGSASPELNEDCENANTVNPEWRSPKVQTNGSVAHITAIFGFTMAGLIMQDINKKALEEATETKVK